ncbi:hypothetical protein F2P81_019658 [Scophthalmus maximus]|uniref:Leucine-rich repeat-containing protein 31 n=1 Tax=Scophthalmus maximus TaxID=52904 RepID=A0A6A4SBV2_SCOMX|nr:hypothetical protein F2P81_019658 [Scophthalmus maximus]
MSQIRRKRPSTSDRKPALGRFLSRTSERTGIPEDGGEWEGREQREHGSGEALGCVPLLEILDLSWNGSVGGGVGGLQGLLGKLRPPLREIHLVACQLTAADAAALGGALSALPRLSVLDVSCNPQLSQEVDGSVGGFRELAASLSHAASLTTLRLQACGLTTGCLHDLGRTSVVGGRLPLLLDALQPSVVLELRLSSCELTTDDLRHLAVASGRGRLSSLRVLDLSYNGSAGDAGWSALFAAGGLGSLEDLDLSLRPSTSASCSAWLPALLGALPRLPALTRLAAQRWALGPRERRQLSNCVRKRDVLLQWDPDVGDAAAAASSSCESTNQESPEE